MNADFISAIQELGKEKGIDPELLFQAVDDALVAAYKKNTGTNQNVRVEMNKETGEIHVYAQRTVVEGEADGINEMTLEDAQTSNPQYLAGDIVAVEVTPKNFGRIAAQNAKQFVVQRIREVKRTNKGPQIMVSRTHPGLLKRLFELEVPEIHDGVVEIKSVAREPGMRSKISVYTADSNVDPVGACVGHKGMRVQTIVNELRGEKIDIVKYSEDPAQYVANALSPAKVVKTTVNEADKICRVVVPDYQLSLAIGKEGQNARLAAKLTGWKIDIKSETQAAEEAAAEPAPVEEA